MKSLRVVLILAIALGASGCRYNKHHGRVGPDSRPLETLSYHPVPQIVLGNSTPEELEGTLRPTVMTVWFQPRKTEMGDMAGGYPLRVQVQPDGFADDRTPFSYSSGQAPKPDFSSRRTRNRSAKVPLIEYPDKIAQLSSTRALEQHAAALQAASLEELKRRVEAEKTLEQKPGQTQQLDSKRRGQIPGIDPKLSTLDYLQQIFKQER